MISDDIRKARHAGLVGTKRSPVNKGDAPVGVYKTVMTQNADAIRAARHITEDKRIARELGIDYYPTKA